MKVTKNGIECSQDELLAIASLARIGEFQCDYGDCVNGDGIPFIDVAEILRKKMLEAGYVEDGGIEFISKNIENASNDGFRHMRISKVSLEAVIDLINDRIDTVPSKTTNNHVEDKLLINDLKANFNLDFPDLDIE